MKNDIHDQVASYYCKTLSTTSVLKTTACCTTESYPDFIKHILSKISDEGLKKYYGCSLTISHNETNLSGLDLVSAVSKLVGENGSITVVDMIDEQTNSLEAV